MSVQYKTRIYTPAGTFKLVGMGNGWVKTVSRFFSAEGWDRYRAVAWSRPFGGTGQRTLAAMPARILLRVGAHDRALMLKCAIAPTAPRSSRAMWTAITHLGGTGPSLIAAGLPWFACCELHQASKLALLTVALSHLIVQLTKRTVARSRPAKVERFVSLVSEPDCFSFPSGHATASMSVALTYGMVFPAWSLPLLVLALLVGFSRVRLGVHYPSDVLVGQLIAALTACGVIAI